METGQWCKSEENLDRTNHGGAFSLGLGITGPELFAAASQAGYVLNVDSCHSAQYINWLLYTLAAMITKRVFLYLR